MKEVRVAILGTGIIAHQHAARYQDIEGVTIVAACDILADKLENFCNQYNIEHRYADYRKMLERDDIDIVSVCVHNNLHTPLAVAVMRAGKDCYCEKPLAGTFADALTIVNAAAETGRKLHVQLAFLYNPSTHAAKKLIEDNKLGKIYHARSYGYRRRGRPFVDGYAEKEFNSKHWAGGGALYDMGVYHISRVLYLLGLPKVERVTGHVYQELPMHEGRRKESGFDVDELGCGFVSFEGGLTMDILESWAIHGEAFPNSMIAGAEGGLSLGYEGDLKFYNEVSGYPMEATVDTGAEQYRTRQIDPTLHLYDESQRHFVGALRGQCPLLPTAKVALQTMLVSEGIYMSSALGREVTVDEIIAKSKSQAITKQETPFGVLEYSF
ncbi:MAG: Gfo/Idh/MocA family oxidoreductase [Defluviitaleaceae bacterium]|nr:Gfo/Idh/MocA family oxidoreductase [Defluviitaleaceae bacterium]